MVWAVTGGLALLLVVWGGCAYAVATTPVRLAYLPEDTRASSEVGTPKKSERLKDKARRAACRSGEDNETPLTLNFYDKEPRKLRATGCNADDEPLTVKTAWSTVASGPVQVSPNGLVSCTATGTGVVIAKAKGTSLTPLELPVRCTLVQGLRSNLPEQLELGAKAAALKAYAVDEQGRTIEGVAVEVTSQNPEILEISGGQFVARRDGEARVTLRWVAEEGTRELEAEQVVQVFRAEGLVRYLRVTSPTRVRLGPSTHPFDVQPIGADGAPVPGVSVSVRSENEDVVVVQDGILRTVGPGVARVRATVGDHVQEVKVEVYETLRVDVEAANPPGNPWDGSSPPDIMARLNGAQLRTLDNRSECGDSWKCSFLTETTDSSGKLRFELLDSDFLGVEPMGTVDCDLSRRSTCEDSQGLVRISLRRAP